MGAHDRAHPVGSRPGDHHRPDTGRTRRALAGVEGLAVADEGTAALVHRGPASADIGDDRLFELIRSVDGVESACPLTPDVWMAWTEPGRMFGSAPIPLHGQHGSPRCRTQMAIVSGGDLALRASPDGSNAGNRRSLDWAPTIAGLLQLDGGGG